jgi:pimeloyl-ACP methyl ester carboxylesterase
MNRPSLTRSLIDTTVGPLQVQVTGAGPPALLWHSLFVDSSTWSRLLPRLAGERRLVLIDGPNHGDNPRRTTPFTLDDCVAAATDVLAQLGIGQPVDWLGNAWGGHVGILFAAAHPERCRTLMAIGAPVHALSGRDHREVRLLSTLYLVGGPRVVVRPLVDALIGSSARREDPDSAAIVAKAFSRAGRLGMFDATRWLSLRRPDLTPVLTGLVTPTVLTTGADDPMWTVPAARAAASHLPNGAAVVLPGAGHVGPLLRQMPAVADLVTGFWRDPQAVIAAQQTISNVQ